MSPTSILVLGNIFHNTPMIWEGFKGSLPCYKKLLLEFWVIFKACSRVW